MQQQGGGEVFPLFPALAYVSAVHVFSVEAILQVGWGWVGDGGAKRGDLRGGYGEEKFDSHLLFEFLSPLICLYSSLSFSLSLSLFVCLPLSLSLSLSYVIVLSLYLCFVIHLRFLCVSHLSNALTFSVEPNLTHMLNQNPHLQFSSHRAYVYVLNILFSFHSLFKK